MRGHIAYYLLGQY